MQTNQSAEILLIVKYLEIHKNTLKRSCKPLKKDYIVVGSSFVKISKKEFTSTLPIYYILHIKKSQISVQNPHRLESIKLATFGKTNLL